MAMTTTFKAPATRAMGTRASKSGAVSKVSKRAFNLIRRTAFYTDMAAFMGADLPPFQALQDMYAVAATRRQTRKLAAVYRSMITAMERGESLSRALAKFVPGSEAVMLVGAETAGPYVLRQAFSELGTLLDRQQKVRQKIRGALVSNGFQLGAIVGMIVFITNLVVPQLAAGITKDMMPHLTFALAFFAFGRHVMSVGPFVAAFILVIGTWVTWSLPRWTGTSRWWNRRWFDKHMMPWTLYVRSQATFFLSSAAAMMRAGIPLKQVVTDMVPFAGSWMRKHMRQMLKLLEAGRSETEALGSGFLPEDTGDRLRIYQRLPDFTKIMTRLSEDNFVQFEGAVDGVNRIMRLVGALLFGLFIISLLFAIFDYTNALYDSVNAARRAAGGA